MNKLIKYVGRKVRLKLAGCNGVVCGYYKDELVVDAAGFHSPITVPFKDSFIEFDKEDVTLAVVPLNIDEVMELSRYNENMGRVYPVSRYDQRTISKKTMGECAKARFERSSFFYNVLNEVWPK